METKSKILISVHTDELKDELSQIIETFDFEIVHNIEDDIVDIVFYEMRIHTENEFAKIQSLIHSHSIDEVFLVSEKSDSTLLLEALRIGVKEFITAPIKEADIKNALDRHNQRKIQKQNQISRKYGKIIAVTGAKGGSGATTVSINVAAGLSKMKKEKSVALADMNLVFGEIPLLLSLEPKQYWDEMINDPSRMDEAFMANVMMKDVSGINVLSAPVTLNGHSRPSSENVLLVMEIIQKMFDFVIVDCGASLNDISKDIIRNSDELLVVAGQSVPSLYNAKRMIDYMAGYELLADDQIKIIINRYDKRSEITMKDAEKSLNKPVYWKIPNNFKIASSSIEQGQSIIQLYPKSPISKNFIELITALTGLDTKAKSGRLTSLFRR